MHNEKQNAYIFGASLSGKSALEKVRAQHNVLGFLDNDAGKAGSEIEGLRVMTPDVLHDVLFDHIFIASEFFEQICQQLKRDFGVKDEQITVLSARDIKPRVFSEHPEHIEMAERILGVIADDFNQSALSYYADAGTLLGMYRDNCLIPWDDDLDFAILSTEINTVKKRLNVLLPRLANLTKTQWTVDEFFSPRNYGAVAKGDVRALKLRPVDEFPELPMVDFFVKYINGDDMDYTLASRGFTMPSRHIIERVLFRFRGFDISIPKDSAGYLTQHYGNDWQTPKQDWNLSMITSAKVFAQ